MTQMAGKPTELKRMDKGVLQRRDLRSISIWTIPTVEKPEEWRRMEKGVLQRLDLRSIHRPKIRESFTLWWHHRQKKVAQEERVGVQGLFGTTLSSCPVDAIEEEEESDRDVTRFTGLVNMYSCSEFISPV